MSFQSFLNEQTRYDKLTSAQISILRQEINRDDLTANIIKNYIEPYNGDAKLFNSDFYLEGIALYKKDKVVIKGSVIVEITEDDNYVYFRPIVFEYVVDDDLLVSIRDEQTVNDENWQNVQRSILRQSIKI